MKAKRAKLAKIHPKTCAHCRYINIPSALECVKCTQPLRKPSKHKNVPTVIDGIKFDSKREAARWQELRLLERAGKIVELERQVVFELAPSVQYSGKRATPVLRYVADFCYFEMTGALAKYVVEDSKGFRCSVYRIKRHLMKSVHGIEIRET